MEDVFQIQEAIRAAGGFELFEVRDFQFIEKNFHFFRACP